MSDLKPWLKRLVAGEVFDAETACEFASALLTADPVHQAAALTALHMRGETAAELIGAVKAVRAVMRPAKAPAGAIDVCGTGGDGAGTLNVSTAVALVVAACGVPVAKHGNRAASSQSGTADVLEALGVTISTDEDGIARCFDTANIAFLFAPDFHPALVRLAPVRRALGFRTLFNLVGPLANPANVSRQLIGVFDPRWSPVVAECFAALGGSAAAVVHGLEGAQGLDELSISGPSSQISLNDGVITAKTIDPVEIGLPPYRPGSLAGGSPAENADALRRLLAGEPGAYHDAVCLNAGAALVVAGVVSDLAFATRRAADALATGAAADTLHQLIKASRPQ